jgi:translation initiation factor 1
MAGKKSRKIPVDGTAERVPNTLLGDLLREHGLLGSDGGSMAKPREAPRAAPPAEAEAPDLSRVDKIILRVQRKGRGGKTVTLLSAPGGGLSPAALEPLAKDLRKALGCGARVEDGSVVIQGDNSERAEKWLLQRGARRVIRGS